MIMKPSIISFPPISAQVILFMQYFIHAIPFTISSLLYATTQQRLHEYYFLPLHFKCVLDFPRFYQHFPSVPLLSFIYLLLAILVCLLPILSSIKWIFIQHIFLPIQAINVYGFIFFIQQPKSTFILVLLLLIDLARLFILFILFLMYFR